MINGKNLSFLSKKAFLLVMLSGGLSQGFAEEAALQSEQPLKEASASQQPLLLTETTQAPLQKAEEAKPVLDSAVKAEEPVIPTEMAQAPLQKAGEAKPVSDSAVTSKEPVIPTEMAQAPLRKAEEAKPVSDGAVTSKELVMPTEMAPLKTEQPLVQASEKADASKDTKTESLNTLGSQQNLSRPIVVETTSEKPSAAKTGNSQSTYKWFMRNQAAIEGKLGYFFFLDSTMSKVYDEGGLDAQLTGTFPIWEGIQFYGSVEYQQKSGKSLNDNQSTSVWKIPVSLGLRSVFTLCDEVQCYLTAGPRFFHIHQHNDSDYVPKSKSKNNVGLFVNAGFNFVFWSHLLIDVFGEYSYEKIHFDFNPYKGNVYGSNVQVGGLVFGGGIGYAF